MTPSFEALVERARHVASDEGFNACVTAERRALPGVSHQHQGLFTGMRVKDFQNWLLERNVEWKLTDLQLLALMRLEFPEATGQIFTADLVTALRILSGVRAHYNRDGHGGLSPQSRGLPPSVSYGQVDAAQKTKPPITSPRLARVPDVAPAQDTVDPHHRAGTGSSQAGLLTRLDSYYSEQGISALSFRCPRASHCRASSSGFTTAKESYVGPAYEAGSRPRLVFLSLDSGSASTLADEKTMAAVREKTLATNVDALHKGKHWYLTHALAFELLRQFHPSLTIATSNRYFAHVNSAKCCANNDQRAKASSVLFKNCRPYIPEELRILDPDVIVTQGDEAREVVESLGVQSPQRDEVVGALYQRGLVSLNGASTALWLHTYHPNAKHRFWAQQKQVWQLYAVAVSAFMKDSKVVARPRTGDR